MKESKRMKTLKIFIAIIGIGGMIFFTILPLFSGAGGSYTTTQADHSAY